MAKVVVMDHPLIQHKIGYIRRKETGTKDFRQTSYCKRSEFAYKGRRKRKWLSSRKMYRNQI